MSATAIFSISGPNYLFTSRRDHRVVFFDPSLLSSRCSSAVFFRYPYGTHKKTRTSSSTSTSIFAPAFKPYSPVMEWQDCTVKMDIDVPISVAYNCYSDREAIPRWMPFISSVKPIPNQKIHWRSLDGLPNRLGVSGIGGCVAPACRQHMLLSEFEVNSYIASTPLPLHSTHAEGLKRCPILPPLHYPPQHQWHHHRYATTTNLYLHRITTLCPSQSPLPSLHLYRQHSNPHLQHLTVSYEVPRILFPVAAALKPFLESLLVRGLERFSNFAKSYSSDSTG
ncbi:polyketide cyclase/dehydrase and lipid transport superfamily protein [Actinidia rufa]|uniref:Polyketide cyclase/dehydrase and lipid transport superfamily protein n=1 Tax=Actinidia rufa TaxID=165716 RepID=A0A7J0H8E2_9ERIC|nr:polyketide cyclase/dehydrase and lipid transport superfamily protein [Actinidia rufa]